MNSILPFPESENLEAPEKKYYIKAKQKIEETLPESSHLEKPTGSSSVLLWNKEFKHESECRPF